MKARVPVLAPIDLGELVMPFLHAVVGAQQSDADRVLLGHITTPDKGMAHHQPPGHLREEIVEIFPASKAREVRRVHLLRLGEIKPVIGGIVEEVALDAPHLLVHLPPFGARVHGELHRVQLQQAFAGLGGLGRIHDGPLAFGPVKQLRTIRGDLEGH